MALEAAANAVVEASSSELVGTNLLRLVAAGALVADAAEGKQQPLVAAIMFAIVGQSSVEGCSLVVLAASV